VGGSTVCDSDAADRSAAHSQGNRILHARCRHDELQYILRGLETEVNTSVKNHVPWMQVPLLSLSPLSLSLSLSLSLGCALMARYSLRGSRRYGLSSLPPYSVPLRLLTYLCPYV
jgi:hypothetical protein